MEFSTTLYRIEKKVFNQNNAKHPEGTGMMRGKRKREGYKVLTCSLKRA